MNVNDKTFPIRGIKELKNTKSKLNDLHVNSLTWGCCTGDFLYSITVRADVRITKVNGTHLFLALPFSTNLFFLKCLRARLSDSFLALFWSPVLQQEAAPWWANPSWGFSLFSSLNINYYFFFVILCIFHYFIRLKPRG